MTREVYYQGKPVSEMFTPEGFIRPDVDELIEARRPERETVLRDPARSNQFLYNIALALLVFFAVALTIWLGTQAWSSLKNRIQIERAVTVERSIAMIEARH